MEQRTNQQPNQSIVRQRAVTLPPNLNSDFGLGLRTLPQSEERPDYARGQRTLTPTIEGPDFARGARTLPWTPEGPDYARGLRHTGP
jgi:hypothetical protein